MDNFTVDGSIFSIGGIIQSNNKYPFIKRDWPAGTAHTTIYEDIEKYVGNMNLVNAIGNYGMSTTDDERGICVIDKRLSNYISFRNKNDTEKLRIFNQSGYTIEETLHYAFISPVECY